MEEVTIGVVVLLYQFPSYCLPLVVGESVRASSDAVLSPPSRLCSPCWDIAGVRPAERAGRLRCGDQEAQEAGGATRQTDGYMH